MKPILVFQTDFTYKEGAVSSMYGVVKCVDRELEIMDGTSESIYLVAFILAGAVYHNALKNRAALLCRACEDFPVCVAVMYLTLRTG